MNRLRGVRVNFRLRAATVGAAVILAALPSTPVQAVTGWTLSKVTGNYLYVTPSLQSDTAGHAHLAVQRYGSNPGIYYANIGTGTVVTRRLSSGDDWDPSLVLDGAAKAHLAFSRASGSPGIYYVTNTTGVWVTTRLTAGPDYVPSLALDGGGKVHLVYLRDDFDPGLFYATNASGSWVETRLTSSVYDWDPSIGLAGGGVYVAFARYSPSDPGIYLVTSLGDPLEAGSLEHPRRHDVCRGGVDPPSGWIDRVGLRHATPSPPA